MKLTVKNMVCNHCVEALVKDLTLLGHEVLSAEIGRAEIAGDCDDTQLAAIADSLRQSGFELIKDPAQELVENVKREIIYIVRRDELTETGISQWLEGKLNRPYKYISSVFSAVEGRTIETYVLLQRIERVKELLIDGRLTVSEIAYKTGFANVGHLSRRFKTFTGMTPSEFRVNGHRSPLNSV